MSGMGFSFAGCGRECCTIGVGFARGGGFTTEGTEITEEKAPPLCISPPAGERLDESSATVGLRQAQTERGGEGIAAEGGEFVEGGIECCVWG